jgi:predicted nuclease with TOPRIM domain
VKRELAVCKERNTRLEIEKEYCEERNAQDKITAAKILEQSRDESEQEISEQTAKILDLENEQKKRGEEISKLVELNAELNKLNAELKEEIERMKRVTTTTTTTTESTPIEPVKYFSDFIFKADVFTLVIPLLVDGSYLQRRAF